VSAEASGTRSRSIGGAALLLAASVLLSRVLGFAREMVIAAQLGSSPETDAFRAAFQIPDMLNYFLAGGALSAALIPQYTRTREQRGLAAAEELLAVVLGGVGACVALATLLLWWQTPLLVDLLFGGFAPETRALTVQLTRIVLPAQFFFITGAIVRAALMSHGRFATQALAPLVYNAAMILGGLVLGGSLSSQGFAWGALAGAVVGNFALSWIEGLRALPLRLRFRVAFGAADFREYLWLAAPLMLGVSLATLDEWYDRFFGSRIGPGVVSDLAFARFLLQAPVAIIGSALATAALPRLAELHSTGRSAELDSVLERTLRAALGLAVLCSAGAIALGEPLVAVMYERGAFSAADTARVAALLAVFAFAIPAWIAQQVAVRGFYARSDMWRPMLLGTGVALAAIPLYQLLGERSGARGLAAAGAIAMSANAAATLLWLRVRHGGPPFASGLAAMARALPPSLVAALAGRLAAQLVAAQPAPIRFGVGSAAFGVAALAAVLAVGETQLRESLLGFLRRAGRRLRRGDD
jgi:putative peptidoglycan lipid II flippase